MKARVKTTGEIVDVEHIIQILSDGRKVEFYESENAIYVVDALDFDIKEKSLPKNEPDYWEKLKHQYAGMAMQGMLSNCEFPKYSTEGYYKHNIANNALEYATTLINKLKEEEK